MNPIYVNISIELRKAIFFHIINSNKKKIFPHKPIVYFMTSFISYNI